ncbi:hypothetical protein BC938DRAFT_484262 [Jimgerdemannia flammicorona]|uniref:Uncharacterized protein n=1 Tax=Jimgerdemannia flammicorona TaxID=994334 RepID=A0A433QAC8_9FUNG|nr:hypothetical protein BC938DRAFT_484262 [Jimgerdemannia flammicorona]
MSVAYQEHAVDGGEIPGDIMIDNLLEVWVGEHLTFIFQELDIIRYLSVWNSARPLKPDVGPARPGQSYSETNVSSYDGLVSLEEVAYSLHGTEEGFGGCGWPASYCRYHRY